MAKGSGNIKGLTVEIAGDTQKLTSALKNVDDEGKKISNDLKAVNDLLKLDPSNVEAVAEKQKILTEAVKNSSERLNELKGYQEQIKQQFADGKIDRGAYLKFQQEVAATENQLNSYQSELDKVNDETKGVDSSTKDMAAAVKKAGDEASGSGSKWETFKSVTVGAAKAAAAAVTAVATAAAGVVTALTAAANETAAFGDNIDKSSQKLGVSAKFYQEWDAVLQHSGTSMDAMGASFKKLATASQSASKQQVAAFEALGLSMEQVSSMSAEELFESVVSGLQGMEESTERTAIATTLLGKGAQELGPLFNTSAEDTQAMIDAVNDLGGVMSNESVKASAAYQDAMQDMQTAMDGAKRNLVSQFLPSMTTVMGGLTALFTGDKGGLAQINSGIKDMVGNITAMLPSVLNSAVEMAKGLIGAVTENLPALAATATDVIVSLADGIITNLPAITDAAMQMVITLAEGIGAALPELVPTIVDVVINIVDVLIGNINLLVDAALQLVTGLAEGLLAALPVLIGKIPEIITSLIAALLEAVPQIVTTGVQLLSAIINDLPTIIAAIVDALPQIITGIINALLDSIPQLVNAGIQLFVALIEGIPTAIVSIVEAVPEICMAIINTLMETDWLDVGVQLIKGIANGLIEGVKNVGGLIAEACSGIFDAVTGFFGIESPSKLFKNEVGVYLAEGLGEGFTSQMSKVSKAMVQAVPTDFGDVSIGYKGSYSGGYNGGYSGGAGQGGGIVFNQYNTSPKALSAAEINKNTRQSLQLAYCMR